MSKSTSEIERDIRAALTSCAIEARGLWHEMRYLIEQSERPGHLQRNGRPVNDGQLAIAAGCPSELVARLLQDLTDVGLIQKSDRCWFSTHLATLCERRKSGSNRTNKWRNKPKKAKKSRKSAISQLQPVDNTGGCEGVSRDTPCDAVCDAPVTVQSVTPPAPSPPEVSPPTTPSSYTPSSPPPVPPSGEANAPGVSLAAQDAQAKPSRKKPEPKRTPEQHESYEACWAWWCNEGWPSTHEGVIYEPSTVGGDRSTLWRILARRTVAYQFEEFKALALVYLNRPAFQTLSHTLIGMGHQIQGLETDLARQRNGTFNGHVHSRKLSAVARGEYASSLPSGSRKLG